MNANDLPRQVVQIVELAGLVPDGLPPFTVYGIHGASDFVIGIHVGDAVLQREPYNDATGAPIESVDGLTIRAVRAHGNGVGYLIYRGLSPDHCKPAKFN